MPGPALTDRDALTRHRRRALAGTPALFLHEDTANEIEERLSEVKRTFTAPAIVTPFPSLWTSRFPDARIIGDADVLDLREQTHDLVIHALSLHWANDPVGQIVQARRALRPDGLFIAVLFGGQTLHELRASLAEAEIEVAGGLSPRVAPMGEIRDLGGLLQRAGLALPVADAVSLTVSYETPFHLMRDLRAMGETNALAARDRRVPPRGMFVRMAELYRDRFALADGRIPATFERIFLSAWSPHESQQQPLRPGSAQIRLADALGSREMPVGDSTGRQRD